MVVVGLLDLTLTDFFFLDLALTLDEHVGPELSLAAFVMIVIWIWKQFHENLPWLCRIGCNNTRRARRRVLETSHA